MNIFHPVFSAAFADKFIAGAALTAVSIGVGSMTTAPLLFGPVNLIDLARDTEIVSSGQLNAGKPLHQIWIKDLVVEHHGEVKHLALDTVIPCGLVYYDNQARELSIDEDTFYVNITFCVQENGEIKSSYLLTCPNEDQEGFAPVVKVLGYTVEFGQLPEQEAQSVS